MKTVVKNFSEFTKLTHAFRFSFKPLNNEMPS